jgi:superfamily II DNA or RNA helicase
MFAGAKLEWESDSGMSMKVKACKKKPGRQKPVKERQSKSGKQPKRSANEFTIPTGILTKRKSIDDEAEEEQGLLADVQHSDDDKSDYDTPDRALPRYLQQRLHTTRNSRGPGQGPIRLPPVCGDCEDRRLGGEEFVKPVFKGTRPPASNTDIVLNSRGPDPKAARKNPLNKIGVIPAPVAKWLRAYQVQGAHFLLERFAWQQGGILGDDMGLGKTIQVISFLTAAFGKRAESQDAHRRRRVRSMDSSQWYPKVLIICPGSLMDNWASELNTWGFWEIDRYHGSAQNKEAVLSAAKSGSVEIVITTYNTYRLNQNQINLVEWDCVVADECHIIKEKKSLITQAMNDVNALCRIGLTGTAIQNKYDELWTLLNWANPGAVSSSVAWKNIISKPLQRGQAHDATTYDHGVGRRTALALKNELLPRFFIRRWKSLIADQLPKKSDRVVFCPLTSLQAEAYNTFLKSSICEYIRKSQDPCFCGSDKKAGYCCREYVNGDETMPWKHFTFPALFTLRHISNHLALLIPEGNNDKDKYERALNMMHLALPKLAPLIMQQKDSIHHLRNPEFCGKFQVLLKLLSWWHGRGDKVLIFSHSVKLLRGLHLLFSSTEYSCSYLDGSMSYEERTQVVDNYNSDDQQFVFLISIKAGGVGLNITSANKVVILDPSWNPSHDLQAQDRAYRIGQTRDVEVFRLISIGTIEEVVYARQIYKQQQANIGYTASLERRYFSGIQGDKDKKGELFGLTNLFTFHEDQVVLQGIVNKTNIAESKAGLLVTDIDLESQNDSNGFKLDERSYSTTGRGDDDNDPAIKALANMLNAQGKRKSKKAASTYNAPRASGIEHILAQAGVQYHHENSEVIGTSRIESKLSRRAMEKTTEANIDQEVMFADEANDENKDDAQGRMPERQHVVKFRPAEDIRTRQFCTMAKVANLSAVEFAMDVESWSQKERRDFLDAFYGMRSKQLESTVVHQTT